MGTGGVKRRRVLKSLRALGLGRITCLNERPNWATPYVDDWIEADPVSPSHATLELVRKRVGRPDGVFTYDDYSVLLAAHLAHSLGLVGIPPEAAERAKNKHSFRVACAEHGLPVPRFCQVNPEGTDTDAALRQSGVGFPVVVKPTHGAGSVLVRRADDHTQLERILSEHAAALVEEPAAALWPDRTVVIEEYLDGAEVDIDMLVQDGCVRYAAVTDNFPPIEPYFMEIGGQIPSALPKSAQTALIDVATRTLRALGVRDGCIHFEARLTARGPVPIEANLRLGGAEVYEFNRGAYGINLVDGAVRIALGLPVAEHPAISPARYLRSTAFIPVRSGTLQNISIAPKVEERDGLAELVVFRAIGDRIRVPPDGFDYLGWMVASGVTRAEAEARLENLVSAIHFKIAEDPTSPSDSPRQ